MGRMMKLQGLGAGTLENIPVEVLDIDRLDYIHAMLGSLLKMMTKPDANTLRSLTWLAKVEARRILEETRETIAVAPRAESGTV